MSPDESSCGGQAQRPAEPRGRLQVLPLGGRRDLQPAVHGAQLRCREVMEEGEVMEVEEVREVVEVGDMGESIEVMEVGEVTVEGRWRR